MTMAPSKDTAARDMSLSNWVLQPIPIAGPPTEAKNGGGTFIVHKTSGRRYAYSFANNLVDGVPHPPFIQEHVWKAQRSQLTFRSEDLFVATYSKCGTTLAEQIVLLLLNGGNGAELNPLHKNTLDRNSGVGKIWTEMAVVEGLAGLEGETGGDGVQKACMGEGKAHMSVEDFDALPSPRILKTHAPSRLFLDAEKKKARVIYVTRNPFDACVSCYYHPKPGVSPHSTGMPFDAFCKLWLSEHIEFGGWINHTKGWREQYQHAYDENQMLWISYEELVSKPVFFIELVASFLEVDTLSDPTLIERVARECKFDNVKRAAQNSLENGAQGDISHLRKGKVGDWRVHFNDELFEQFEQEIRSHFREHDSYADIKGLEYDIGEGRVWRLTEDEDVVANTNDIALTFILGATMIFYSILQMTLQYLNQFYVDDLRDANGLSQPSNFPAISIVIANVFNGVNGGLAFSTAVFAGRLIRSVWSGERQVFYFFVSIVTEALVTSGVLHSAAHRLFGATLDGNAYVEFFSHIGYSINVIVTAILLICWLSPLYLRSNDGVSPEWHPRPIEIGFAIAVSILAVFFTQRWVPYEPNPEDFEYDEFHSFNESRIIFLQRNIQGVLEGILLIPTILLLFIFRRLWSSIRSTTSRDSEQKLSFDTLRLCILSTCLPLLLNWVHFRCHDDLVNSIQETFGWSHHETITAIRVVFHFPAWIFSIARIHYFRLLTEQRAGWPTLDIIETICPGREIFPFAMVFLYRASEGMTISLLPSFFQGGGSKFYMDITENTWVAYTVLGMFVGNAVGSISLGLLMQKRGYKFAYTFLCVAFLVVFPLYMVPHTNTSFFIMRCITSLFFPGPVVLSKVTQNTRKAYTGVFKHIPMVTSLIWFNQGFWFGGVISNSSVWTPWNVFFTSAVVLFALFICLFIAFLMTNNKNIDDIDPLNSMLATSATSQEGDDDNRRVIDSTDEDLTNRNFKSRTRQLVYFAGDPAQEDSSTSRIGDEDDGSVSKVVTYCEPSSALFRDDALYPHVFAQASSASQLSDSEGRSVLRNHISSEPDIEQRANKSVCSSQEKATKNKLLLARVSSFANGASFACHISLLPIQVTKLVDLDVYEYATIISSLGSISTVLILLNFRWMSQKDTSFSMSVAYFGHMIGTAVLCIPPLYSQPMGIAVFTIVISYGAILISFFIMNLACEVSLGQVSLQQRTKKDAAAGLQMGIIKSSLSIGKVGGAAMVAFTFRIHPQLPLWILEGLLIIGALITAAIKWRKGD